MLHCTSRGTVRHDPRQHRARRDRALARPADGRDGLARRQHARRALLRSHHSGAVPPSRSRRRTAAAHGGDPADRQSAMERRPDPVAARCRRGRSAHDGLRRPSRPDLPHQPHLRHPRRGPGDSRPPVADRPGRRPLSDLRRTQGRGRHGLPGLAPALHPGTPQRRHLRDRPPGRLRRRGDRPAGRSPAGAGRRRRRARQEPPRPHPARHLRGAACRRGDPQRRHPPGHGLHGRGRHRGGRPARLHRHLGPVAAGRRHRAAQRLFRRPVRAHRTARRRDPEVYGRRPSGDLPGRRPGRHWRRGGDPHRHGGAQRPARRRRTGRARLRRRGELRRRDVRQHRLAQAARLHGDRPRRQRGGATRSADQGDRRHGAVLGRLRREDPHCGAALRHLGSYPLRGVGQPLDVYTFAEDPA